MLFLLLERLLEYLHNITNKCQWNLQFQKLYRQLFACNCTLEHSEHTYFIRAVTYQAIMEWCLIKQLYSNIKANHSYDEYQIELDSVFPLIGGELKLIVCNIEDFVAESKAFANCMLW